MNKTETINFRLKPVDREALLNLAKKKGLMLGQLIREILRERLIKEKMLDKHTDAFQQVC